MDETKEEVEEERTDTLTKVGRKIEEQGDNAWGGVGREMRGRHIERWIVGGGGVVYSSMEAGG